jgi:hypothetical protein
MLSANGLVTTGKYRSMPHTFPDLGYSHLDTEVVEAKDIYDRMNGCPLSPTS